MKARGEPGVSDSPSGTRFKAGSFGNLLRTFGERDLDPFCDGLVVNDGSDWGVGMCMKSSLPEDPELQDLQKDIAMY